VQFSPVAFRSGFSFFAFVANAAIIHLFPPCVAWFTTWCVCFARFALRCTVSRCYRFERFVVALHTRFPLRWTLPFRSDPKFARYLGPSFHRCVAAFRVLGGSIKFTRAPGYFVLWFCDFAHTLRVARLVAGRACAARSPLHARVLGLRSVHHHPPPRLVAFRSFTVTFFAFLPLRLPRCLAFCTLRCAFSRFSHTFGTLPFFIPVRYLTALVCACFFLRSRVPRCV